MNENFNEYRELFLEETLEQLEKLRVLLLKVDAKSSDKATIDEIFRIIHTLKSSSAAVGLEDLSKLTHHIEDFLQNVRNDEISLTADLLDVFFEYWDFLKKVVDEIGSHKDPPPPDVSLSHRIETLLGHISAPDPGAGSADSFPSLALDAKVLNVIREQQASGKKIWELKIAVDHRAQLKWLKIELMLNALKKDSVIITFSPAKTELIKPAFDGKFSLLIATSSEKKELSKSVLIDQIELVSVESFKPTDIHAEKKPVMPQTEKTKPIDTPKAEPEEALKASTFTSNAIRVNISRLDELMNLIGEMSTSVGGVKTLESALRKIDKRSKFSLQAEELSDRLDNLSQDLEYSILKTRLLPVSTVFSQFQRVIRDLSKKTGKMINLKFENEDTELDKKIIDGLNEPLMHLVRNSIDHGIESPEERRKNGKPETGTITLSALQQGNSIVIVCSDDGKGIDPVQIKATALQKKVKSKSELEGMTEEELKDLLFLPGFSTAETVTDLSGRGVGLDVVRDFIKKLNGNVEVRSETGKNTAFILTLPVTLTTTNVILVKIAEIVMALPMTEVVETLRVLPDQIRTIEGAQSLVYEEEIIPLVSARQVMNIPEMGVLKKNMVVVVWSGNRKAGLIIDKILGDTAVVIKNIETNYTAVEGFRGVTILVDGTLSPVIDPPGFVNLANGDTREDTRNSMNTRISKAS